MSLYLRNTCSLSPYLDFQIAISNTSCPCQTTTLVSVSTCHSSLSTGFNGIELFLVEHSDLVLCEAIFYNVK